MHPCQLDLNPTDRVHLEAITRRSTSSQQSAFRALVVLMVADGNSISGAARALGCCRQTVRKWVRRMTAGGIAGLEDAQRSGRPRRISSSERHSVIALACSRPEDAGLAGHSEWSGNLLAEVLVSSGRVAAISGRSVQRVLKGADLKPHRCEYWKRKTDPQFDAKMRPIVDLYLNPPSDGPVWCFDEMTCIQALERCFPELPLRRPGELVKRSFEYVRHGTRCLLAALEVHTGRILGQVYPRRRREEFVAFLDRLDAEVLAGQVIHLVLDNLNVHRGPHVDQWLICHPGRIVFHFLPFHASWLNQIEIWFNTLQRRCLRRGDFRSTEALEAVISDFIATYNRLHAHPYRWTYSGDPLVA
jgi:transposase